MSNSKISGLFLVARKQLDFEFFLPHFLGASLLTFVKFIGEKKSAAIPSLNCSFSMDLLKKCLSLICFTTGYGKIEDLSQCSVKKKLISPK